MTWRDRALCRGRTATFLPNDEHAKTTIVQAREICAVCPVAAECLAFAMQRPEAAGVWAGTTPDDRVKARDKPRSEGPCGTWSHYNKGCRLPECVEAARNYSRERGRRRRLAV